MLFLTVISGLLFLLSFVIFETDYKKNAYKNRRLKLSNDVRAFDFYCNVFIG